MFRQPNTRRALNARHSRILDAAVGFERLESRRMLSAAQPSFADFSSTTGLTTNGYGGSSTTANNALTLTDGINGQARSVFWTNAVPIDSFSTTFSYTVDQANSDADGFTFTIQGNDPTSLGGNGANLGYGSIIKSVALGFNLFNGGSEGTMFGFSSDGQTPATNTDASPVDLHNGDTYNATINYDGTTLAVTMVDANDSSKTFSASEQVDIPTTVGGDTAIVGFTASTGNSSSTQSIRSWTFAGTDAPTVATAAHASASTTNGKSVDLSVLGTDKAGESNLTYSWSLVTRPSGGRAPTFSADGTNGAKHTTARFYKDGSYRFRATITNQLGESTVSDISVTVKQKATEMRLAPHSLHLSFDKKATYKATVLDQFHHAMRTAPTIVYSIQSGGGSIGKSTGVYVAPKTQGHVVILASDNGDYLTGVVGATVTA